MSNIVVDSNSAFYDTYKVYKNYIGYTEEYSYKQWMRLDDSFKAAALFVQFYNEITLAWYKVKTKWSIEEEGVEHINQYLIKNVEKIKSDKKRFDPRYIYRVAYNCLYCVCIDPSKNKDRYYNETPSIFYSGEDEMDWFDTLGQFIDFDSDRDKEWLQTFVESLGEDFQIYISYLLKEATDTQICKKLKKMNMIDGNVLNASYREEALKHFSEVYSEKLKCKMLAFAN